MNYGLYFKEVSFNRQSVNVVRKAISQNLEFSKENYIVVKDQPEVQKLHG